MIPTSLRERSHDPRAQKQGEGVMAKKVYLNTYGPGLSGVRGGKLRGPMADGVGGFMKALMSYRVVSDAGDHGSVMVHVDDDGMYRCAFMVWQHVRASEILKTKTAVRNWLKEWLPRQRIAT